MTLRLRPRLFAALLGVGSLAGLALPGPAACAAVAPSTAPATPTAGASAPGFVAVGPKRLLDTRTSATTPAPGPAGTVSVAVTGVAAVPGDGVEAVVLNVTAIARTHSTFVTVFPTGASRPNASNLNLTLGQTRANQVIALVGANGSVSLYNSSGTTDLIVDVTGYLTTTSTYSGQSPVRILDTRAGGGAPVSPATTRTVPVAGVGGVPADATSVVLNLTGISTGGGTFVTAFPGGTARPNTSNLNLVAGQTAAVLVIAKVGAGGAVNLYNSGGPTHLLLDVEGWFTGTADYTPVPPTRLVDTRGSTTIPYGQDTQVPATTLTTAPPGSGAAVLSVTAVNPSASGYVTVHAGGTPVPLTSSLNTSSGATVANLVVTQLSTSGKFAIFDRAPGADLVVDVVGWFRTNRALAFPTPTIGVGTVGQAYSATLPAAGGRPPYAGVLAVGTLPDGLSLSPSTGEVSGTPTTAGSQVVTVRIRDTSGQSAQRVLTFTVAAGP
jgi:hypothetical protein